MGMKVHSIKVNKRETNRSIVTSSAIEGQSFTRAKNNKTAKHLLKQHGRAFSV